MASSVEREAVDLSGYPDLVVIYLGMRVRTFAGIRTLLGLGPKIEAAGKGRPEGLLHYETNILLSLFPMHLMMRWYWRDFESMERFTRSEPHRLWWQKFMRDSGGTSFWHETYVARGGMEAIYADLKGKRLGFAAFAPVVPARGSMYSARARARLAGQPPLPPAGVPAAG
jgi:hypothetical protein